jgi:hypothetical protein
VQAVYYANTEAIQVADLEGGLPIHHASTFNSNVEVVRFLHNQYPAGVRVVQSNGLTPLHLAASQNSHYDVLKYLIEIDPDAVYRRDSAGCYKILKYNLP